VQIDTLVLRDFSAEEFVLMHFNKISVSRVVLYGRKLADDELLQEKIM
jgi:hypothetical protein